MGIVYACIAPHGAEIIPKLAGSQLETFDKTRCGMERLTEQMKKYDPTTIVIATPHGLRLTNSIGVVTSEYCEGSLQNNRKSVRLRFRCDRELAFEILVKSKKTKLPIIGVNFGTDEGPSSSMPMDWGTLIPLWFLSQPKKNRKKLKIVVVTPSREILLSDLVDFGKAIADVVEKSTRKVAFVASADQGHAHDKNGPYGFNQASAKYDKLVLDAVKENNFNGLLSLSNQFLKDAKPDSLWQIAILVGILDSIPMKGQIFSYQAPTYYGMLCAGFEPTKGPTNIKKL